MSLTENVILDPYTLDKKGTSLAMEPVSLGSETEIVLVLALADI